MLGHELLATLHSLPADGNAAALLRHAERFPITNPEDPTAAELTPSGISAARDMGGRLRGFSHLRLFHSPVKRCRQTAEALCEGARSAGLQVELVGEAPALGVFYIEDLAEAGRLHLAHGDDFIRLWFEGLVRDGVVQAPEGIVLKKLAHVSRHLAQPSTLGRRLDLHISHDWNILILRELMLGVRHETAGWLNFLDGLAFTLDSQEKLTAFYRGHQEARRLPWQGFHRRAHA